MVEGLADATRKVESFGFVIVRVTTDQGLEGFGVTYHEVGGEAVAQVVTRNLAPYLIGRDPLAHEEIWQHFFHYLRGVGRKGLSFCALSAVDIALWDLKGKLLGLPLYRLFGGSRSQVPVYASGGWTSHSDDALVAEACEMVRRGYDKIKIKVGVEGGRNLRRDRRRVQMVRDAIGPEVALMLDANNCWDAATAVKFANSVREFDIFLFEEPVFADDIPGLARFKRGTDIPLATGEHEYTKFGFRDLLIGEAVDIVQGDFVRAGGFTEALKIAALSQAWNLKFAPHAMEHIHSHLVSAAPNALFVERLLLFEEITHQVYANAPSPVNGYLGIPDGPGLGLELNMDFIRAKDEL
jgi:L-alanine-DL-glutamate epimerase-like enolase superfamily enzyme